MLKKAIAIGLTMCTISCTAFAEQAKVQEYRNVFPNKN